MREIERQVGDIGQRTEISKELDAQALADLRLGGQLSPEEERAVQQSSREIFAARGMALSDPAAVAEVLARDSFARQRRGERQAFAGQRENVGFQMNQAERQYLLGSTQLTDAINPAWKILGMQSGQTVLPDTVLGVAGLEAPPGVGGIMGAGLSYGSDLFGGNMNMAGDLFNTSQNNMAAIAAARMQAAAQIKSAQIQAAAMTGAASSAAGGQIGGALIGAAGSVGGAGLSAAAPAIGAALAAF